MLSQTLSQLFERDLPKVKAEIEAYSSEEAIWQKADGINNNAGNLALHIAGNIQHFFGGILGDTGYSRDREFEFNGRVSTEELYTRIDDAIASVTGTLEGMTDEEIKKDYPIELFGGVITNEWFFLHLYSHMLYHLGQINYHRRLLDK
ncbi:MAG: DinB family protein [Balneola sp.]|nr:MAG: DinB family protein [Balneola sp.]